MKVELNPSERIEDLQCDGLQLIQSSDEYRFTTDAVLLANFCRDMRGKLCVEFGAGSGVISLLIARKKHPRKIVALEIQPQLANLMQRNVNLNDLQELITVHNCDLKNAADFVQNADVVICNPPYRRVGSGEQQLKENIAICRHEIKATLCDVIKSASRVLNNRGSLYLVHQSDRLCEIVMLCQAHGIAVKEILPVCPAPNKEPNLVLVRGVKAGEQDCKLRAPMYVTDEQGNYTPQAKAWYGLE
ncbi:MAG: methyltransferase [Clostridiales bacterium]|nr:methyltransferase [Clostridiales bacterium]